MQIQALQSSLTLPVIAAPMFLVSGTALVTAACNSGIVGTFPSLNGRTTQDFEQMLLDITAALQAHEATTGKKPAPFGVNLIVHKTNQRLAGDLALCEKYKVPLVITSLGAVHDIVDRVHAYGGLVFHDVIKKRHAEKAVEAGVDGIIAVAAGAGGHAGTANPFALVQQIRSIFKGTLILAGSINSAREILAARILGADFAYMGTRFIATQESLASEAYKQMLLAAELDDIVYTDEISGVPGNYLQQSIDGKAGQPEKGSLSQLSQEKPKAWKDIWSAGHGVSGIHSIPAVQDLVLELQQDYEALLKTACSRL